MRTRSCWKRTRTGGFLFTAHNHVVGHNKNLTREQLKHLREKAFTGYQLVQATARVCAINMMLHGICSEKSVPVIFGEDGRTSTEKDIIERDELFFD